MFNSDEARERSAQGKRDQEFRELMQSVGLEINEARRYRHSSVTYKIGRDDDEFVEPLLNWLNDGDDLSATYEESTRRLLISIELEDEPEVDDNELFRELVNSVTYEINDATRSGSYSTSYKVSESEVRLVDALIEYLKEDNRYSVSYNAGRRMLSISWTQDD